MAGKVARSAPLTWTLVLTLAIIAATIEASALSFGLTVTQ
jgi:hypothetical protein